MTHRDDLAAGSPAEAAKRRTADDVLMALASARLGLDEKPKPATWWSEWVKPGVLIPMAMMAGGAFITYQHDLSTTTSSIAEAKASAQRSAAELSASLERVSSRLDRDERDTADRVREYTPIIREGEVAQKQREIIDKQQNDRIEAIAQSVLQLRDIAQKQGDAISKTHEEMMVIEARRQREGMLTGHAPAQDAGPGAR